MGRIQIGKREAFTLSLFGTNHSLALLLLPSIYCESRVCNEKVLKYHQLLNYTHHKVGQHLLPTFETCATIQVPQFSTIFIHDDKIIFIQDLPKADSERLMRKFPSQQQKVTDLRQNLDGQQQLFQTSHQNRHLLSILTIYLSIPILPISQQSTDQATHSKAFSRLAKLGWIFFLIRCVSFI